MTREEAIKELKILKEDYWDDDGYGHETQQYDDTLLALDMAINALEQEPCDDAISRQAVLEKAYAYGYGLEPEGYCVNVEDIQALPSVTPEYTKEEIDRAQAAEQAYIDKMVELAVEELKRPKGKWISHREHCENLGAMPNGLGAYQWCSNCDCAIDIREWQRNHYNFCPNCGADMRESEDKE